MSISVFSQRKQKRKIQELEIDATIRENHTYSNTITDYPVEDGFNVTDNAKQKPVKLVIEGVTTNAPLDNPSDNVTRDDKSDRKQNAFNYIIGLAGFSPSKQSGIEPLKVFQPQIIDIVTGLKTYTNMMIENVNFPVTARTGQSVFYTLELKQIKKVQPRNVFVPKVSEQDGRAPNIKNQAGKNINGGRQSTKDVDTDTLLYNWFVDTGVTTTTPGAQP
jgi:hypothetical protein